MDWAYLFAFGVVRGTVVGCLWPIMVAGVGVLPVRMLALGLIDENIDFAFQFDGGFLEVLYIGDS